MLSPEIALQAPEALKQYQEGLLWEYQRRIQFVDTKVQELLVADDEISEYLGEDSGQYQLGVLLDAQDEKEGIDLAHSMLQYEAYLSHGFQPQ